MIQNENDLPVFGNLAISNISTIVHYYISHSFLNINLLPTNVYVVVNFQIENIWLMIVKSLKT